MARTPKKDTEILEQYEKNPALDKTAQKPTGTNLSTAKDADKKL
jgi:hypothetical protein